MATAAASPTTALHDLPSVLTVPEVAAVLRLRRETTYLMVADGRLPSFRTGKNIRVSRDDLIAFIEEGGTRDTD